MITCYIGLGSNLGTPRTQLDQALQQLAALPHSHVQACSSFYLTRPVGPQDQPDFLNAVAQLDTALPPLSLLDQLQHIEQQAGRQRTRHWGPRTLDLDILLYGDQQLDLPRLTVPHPHMYSRAFVLAPLYEIAADLILPDGSALKERYHQVDATGIKKAAFPTSRQNMAGGSQGD